MLRISSFLGLIMLSSIAIAQGPVPLSGLIAFYELNGNGDDSSGNEYDGEEYFMTPTEDRFGNPQGAIDFNGVSSRLETGYVFDLPVMTVSAWAKAEYIWGTGEQANVVLTQDSYELTNGLFRMDFTGGDMKLWAGGNTSVYQQEAETDVWYHMVLIRNGLSSQYYVNGELVAEGVTNDYASSDDPNIEFVIGSGRSLTYQFFDGQIDDVAIYNRVLHEDEIADIYEYIPTDITAYHSGTPGVVWKGDRIEIKNPYSSDQLQLLIHDLSGRAILDRRLEPDTVTEIFIPDQGRGILIVSLMNDNRTFAYSEKGIGRL